MIPIRDTIPTRHPPVMTWWLIVATVIVFLFEVSLSEGALERLFYLFGVVPARFTHPDWARWVGFPAESIWPFLTSLFLHGGFIHILANMWTLWIFGDNVEDRMGPVRFLLFYLVCGIVAQSTQIAAHPHSTVPAIGASGAIAGVLGAYFVMYPLARVVMLVPILFLPVFFEVPAFIFLFIWFISQLMSGAMALVEPAAGAGIAWWAHIGGFLTGVLLHRLFLRPLPRAKRAERRNIQVLRLDPP